MALAQLIKQAFNLRDIGGQAGRIDHPVAMGMGLALVDADRPDELALALAGTAMVPDQSCDENVGQLRSGHGDAYLSAARCWQLASECLFQLG
jgi:hypothetical protein